MKREYQNPSVINHQDQSILVRSIDACNSGGLVKVSFSVSQGESFDFLLPLPAAHQLGKLLRKAVKQNLNDYKGRDALDDLLDGVAEKDIE